MVLMELKMPYRLNDFVFLFILLFPTPTPQETSTKELFYLYLGGKTSHITIFLKDRQLMEDLWARYFLGLPQAYKIGRREHNFNDNQDFT